MGGKGEGESQRRYPRRTRIEIDENGRRIVTLPQIGGSRISIDNKNIRGTELTKGKDILEKTDKPLSLVLYLKFWRVDR